MQLQVRCSCAGKKGGASNQRHAKLPTTSKAEGECTALLIYVCTFWKNFVVLSVCHSGQMLHHAVAFFAGMKQKAAVTKVSKQSAEAKPDAKTGVPIICTKHSSCLLQLQ